MSSRLIAGASALAMFLTGGSVHAEDYLVRSQKEYFSAARKLAPGDTIRLADGTWNDFSIIFQGKGTRERPITLTAEHNGGVILSGKSDLRLSGSYLVVSGLVFRDGYAPRGEVISFRRDDRSLADHSRLTEVVVDNYNQPDRRLEDHWVSLYGRENRIDHSWFAGKGNAGVMLAVIRPNGQGQANRHLIDHNYFGPRPPLGSNGGETIRIGTSEESLSDSATVVENNMFDRCDGEVEIVSVKSGGNVIRGNLFLRSQGSIVLRHGSGNLVERNVFLGFGKAHTGGVRVINSRQTVRDNYMEGLAGTDFASAVAVMNGVPNSAINRYHPVSQALIANNSVFDAARVTLGAGADAERTVPPTQSTLQANLFTGPADLFDVKADMAGLTLSANVTTSVVPGALTAGVRNIANMSLSRADNGLLYPKDPTLAAIGAPSDLKMLTPSEVGPTWYAKSQERPPFGYGHKSLVRQRELVSAVAKAKAGDVLQLQSGRYEIEAPLSVSVPLTLVGPKDAEIVFSSPTLFTLTEGGALRIEGVTIKGDSAPRRPGNAVVRSSAASTIMNYAVELTGTTFTGLDDAPAFDLIATTPGTFADHIELTDVTVSGLSGKAVAAAAEPGDKGLYAAEVIRITGSHFDRVAGIAEIFRGGTDESTFGPKFEFIDNEVTETGSGPLRLSGVQSTIIEGNTFRRSGAISVAHSVGAPVTRILRNRLIDTPDPVITSLYPQGRPLVEVSDNLRTGDAS